MNHNIYGGVEIITSYEAMKEGDVRAFPESRNRSARIRKKLMKRFGGEFYKVPCMYWAGGRIIAHPSVYHDLKRRLDALNLNTVSNTVSDTRRVHNHLFNKG